MINRSCNWLWSMVSIAKGWYLFMLCLTLILASILNLLIIYSWICSENRILAVKNQCWRPAAGPPIFWAFWDQSRKCPGDGDRSVDISSLVYVRIFPGFGDKLINRMKKVLKWSLSQKERYRLVNALNGTTVPNDWFLSRIVRNRLIHALTGNTMVNKQVKRKTLNFATSSFPVGDRSIITKALSTGFAYFSANNICCLRHAAGAPIFWPFWASAGNSLYMWTWALTLGTWLMFSQFIADSVLQSLHQLYGQQTAGTLSSRTITLWMVSSLFIADSFLLTMDQLYGHQTGGILSSNTITLWLVSSLFIA